MINLIKLIELTKSSDYLTRDYENNVIYSSDIVIYNSIPALAEYALYNKEYYLLLYSPMFSYRVKFILLSDYNSKKEKFLLLKRNKKINYLINFYSRDEFYFMKKIYKGILYRKKWNILPNIITKNIITTKIKSNFDLNKDYNKYNIFILLNKNNTNHNEFIFRGDNE